MQQTIHANKSSFMLKWFLILFVLFLSMQCKKEKPVAFDSIIGNYYYFEDTTIYSYHDTTGNLYDTTCVIASPIPNERYMSYVSIFKANSELFIVSYSDSYYARWDTCPLFTNLENMSIKFDTLNIYDPNFLTSYGVSGFSGNYNYGTDMITGWVSHYQNEQIKFPHKPTLYFNTIDKIKVRMVKF